MLQNTLRYNSRELSSLEEGLELSFSNSPVPVEFSFILLGKIVRTFTNSHQLALSAISLSLSCVPPILLFHPSCT